MGWIFIIAGAAMFLYGAQENNNADFDGLMMVGGIFLFGFGMMFS